MNEIQNMQKHLATLRKTFGWTQKEFAEKLGISRASLSYLETMRVKMSGSMCLAVKCIVYETLEYHFDWLEHFDKGTYLSLMLFDCFILDPGDWFNSEDDEQKALEGIEFFAENALATRKPCEVSEQFCRWLETEGLNYCH